MFTAPGDRSGRRRIPPIAFLVNKGGSNQSIVVNTYTKLTWANSVYNYGKFFNSDIFKPNIHGIYEFTLQLYYTAGNTGDAFENVIYLNGVLLFENIDRWPTTSGKGNTVTWQIELNGTTDYIEFYTWQGHAVAKNVSGDITLTCASGALIIPL